MWYKSRREFLGHVAMAGVGGKLGTLTRFSDQSAESKRNSIQTNDPKAWEICLAAINAAKSAGATYADVRLTYTSNRTMGAICFGSEVIGAGVRALVDGHWGFASSPILSIDEGARLGKAAVRQAKASSIEGSKDVDTHSPKSIDSGQWIMPVKDDPFELNQDEIADFMGALSVVSKHFPGTSISHSADFRRTDKYFTSTNNQKLFQRTYLTSAHILLFYMSKSGIAGSISLDSFSPAGRGFEYLRENNINEQLRAAYEELKEDLALPSKPLEVGRYSILLDRATTANLLHKTIGPATELDRILGYEANSTGTSFIRKPGDILQPLKCTSDVITLTADRSSVGGAGTVKWDDEGIEPKDITLIDKGFLKEVQTDHERAAYLKKSFPNYHVTASTGNMVAENAQVPPNIFSGNLTLAAGDDSATEKAMLEEMGDGIFIKRGNADIDFQLSSGIITGNAYEVRKGKRTASLSYAGVMFSTMDLWKSAIKVGGRDSQRTYGFSESKTNYRAQATASVTSSPVLFADETVIDLSRKA